MLKDVRRDQMVLLCEGHEASGNGCHDWLLVTSQSDTVLVIERGSLKLIERTDAIDIDQLKVAFPVAENASHNVLQQRGAPVRRKWKAGKTMRAGKATRLDGDNGHHAIKKDRFDDNDSLPQPQHLAMVRFADDDDDSTRT